MASDFFEQQDLARKRTGRLVLLFAAAVVSIIVLVYGLVVVLMLVVQNNQPPSHAGPAAGGATTLETGVPYLAAFAATVVGVLVVVGGSSVFKIAQLRSGGGGGVAQSLGGRLVRPDTTDTDERKLVNVVEEMAIASGTAVPPVFIMEREKGINAFAAGYSPDSAVIGVTRGCIEQLSRDELQGVIAHEFSHILNGDMRLNIRLMGLIFGILAIAVLGRVIVQGMFYSSATRSRSSNSKEGGGKMVILLIGVALIVIGSLGVFFGKLIKAAISRQREYLADASAVQFTRNPDGIGNALKRIGGYTFGTRVESPHAEEAAHMFFGEAVSSWLGGAMATHPPLDQRIRWIDKGWDGKFLEQRQTPQLAKRKSSMDRLKRGGVPGLPGMGDHGFGKLDPIITGAVIAGSAGGGQATKPDHTYGLAIDQVGAPTPQHVDHAHALIEAIPEVLKDSARQPYGARAVVYVVLLDRDQQVRRNQLKHLSKHADRAVSDLTHKLVDAAHGLMDGARLPLIDMALPALRQMSDGQFQAFKTNIEALIKADQKVDLFEWTLQRLLLRHLDAHFHPAPDPRVHYYNLKPIAEHCEVVLSALAHIGQRDESEAQHAFDLGFSELGLTGSAMGDRKSVRLSRVGQALDELNRASPREKKKLLKGCARTIAADGEVGPGEGELMRAIADSLGCPMPPMLPGQKLV
ncbi:MAG: M48 family metallopeptidase [Planctomycetota bacterium]